jgi:hypothetical protein
MSRSSDRSNRSSDLDKFRNRPPQFFLISFCKPWATAERGLELGMLEAMRIQLAMVLRRKIDLWDHLSFPRIQLNRAGGSESVTQKKACFQERKEKACQTRPIRFPSYLGQSVASMEANLAPNRSFQKMKSMHPGFYIAQRS